MHIVDIIVYLEKLVIQAQEICTWGPNQPFSVSFLGAIAHGLYGCLTCVEQHVVLEVGLLAEAPVTDVTLEWPRAIVHVHMALQVPGGGERLGAQAALVRLLLHGASTTLLHYVLLEF